MTVPSSNSYMVHVQFTFPFHLGMEPSSFPGKFDGSYTLIQIQSGFMTRKYELVPPAERKDQSEYHVYESRLDMGDGTERHARTIVISKVPQENVVEVADTYGFTHMHVFFVQEGNPEDADSTLLRQEALRRAQHFTKHYRLATMDHYVGVPTDRDSFAVKLATSTEYKITPDIVTGRFESKGVEFRWDKVRESGLNKKVPESLVRALAKSFESNEPLYLHNELMSEAAELSLLHEDHKLAIVVAETSFEAFVQFRIAEECRVRGLTRLTDRGGTERAVAEALDMGDLKRDLLGDYAAQLSGRDVKSGREYQRWHADTYEPRNEIVHAGRVSVTEDEAKRAVESAVGYTRALGAFLAAGRGKQALTIRLPAPYWRRKLGRALQRWGSTLAQPILTKKLI